LGFVDNGLQENVGVACGKIGVGAKNMAGYGAGGFGPLCSTEDREAENKSSNARKEHAISGSWLSSVEQRSYVVNGSG
jgi:hypothetical protein